MSKENPYVPPHHDESGSNGTVLVVSAVVLCILAGLAIWQNLVFLGTVAGVLLLFVLLGLPSEAWQEEWKLKWPAISDDEFMAKCGPDIDRETALKVRRIISEQLGIDYERIHPEQTFVGDLGYE